MTTRKDSLHAIGSLFWHCIDSTKATLMSISITATGLTGFAGLWGVSSCRGARPCCVFAKLQGGANVNFNEWLDRDKM